VTQQVLSVQSPSEQLVSEQSWCEPAGVGPPVASEVPPPIPATPEVPPPIDVPDPGTPPTRPLPDEPLTKPLPHLPDQPEASGA